MFEYLSMLFDEVSKQLEQFNKFRHSLEKFGKVFPDVRYKMHGGCNFENNINQTKPCKFQNKIHQWYC